MSSLPAQHRVTHAPIRGEARAVVLLVIAIASIGGCQTRREAMSQPARIFYDSLVASFETRFDSATANLAYDRNGCLYVRASASLGSEMADRLFSQAEREARSRRSNTERAAAERGMEMDHAFWTPEVCRRIDSLWYAGPATRRKARPH